MMSIWQKSDQRILQYVETQEDSMRNEVKIEERKWKTIEKF